MLGCNFNFAQPFSTNNQINGYSYDAAGDLLSDGLGNTYSYNVEGMMTASNGAQYAYDALDQEVAKIGGANAAEIIYFAGKQIALRNASTGGYSDLIWAGNRLIAWVAGTQTAAPTYRLVDHLGSLAMSMDGSGNVTGTNIVSPYGQVLSSNTVDPYPYAQLTADTNGTDQAQFQDYGTAPGRWTRPDPYNGSYDLANPQSFNRYVYAMDNPLGLTDPSGLSVYVCDEGGGCGFVDDNTYLAAQATDQFNHAPGLGNSGNIYDNNGNIVGTAQYFSDPGVGIGANNGWGDYTFAQ